MSEWTLVLNCDNQCDAKFYVRLKTNQITIQAIKLICSKCEKEYEFYGEIIRKVG